jgi:hypothetical protein
VRKSKVLFFCAVVAALPILTAATYAGTEHYAGVRQEAVTADCSGSKECFIYFNPAELDLQIQKVSCNYFLKASNVQVLGAELLRSSRDKSKQIQAQHVTVNYENGYGSNFSQYQFLADVLWGIPQNWRPTVHIWYDQSVDGHFDCTISGPAP